ncbi:MAG: hypothetical protein COT88_00355 [Candidatus Colwellbacteria bacterium CG10_big_fil_rev_8_21_14_0_10_41_28]|uniref:Type II secretion system protein GspF domain-containing protein n=1 Tax=Candidatus Colwellbacteria bacterium CG10_big_fil_rev_8_21_14_0_10_41_28 TaxID=1974539 RepID=A0A2H0VHW1_9BACT|nr:MAG: hypothetical protein COT88_00355 [Candidatus Colwellbacteria bacterium CG10_big_fil_rev_8_21_14_0_10_41_28]
MKFKYKARTVTGELQVGFVDGADRGDAANILDQNQLIVLSVESAEQKKWWDKISEFFGRVKLKDLMIFSRQFSTMLEAKVPIHDSLSSIEKQTKNQTLKEAIREVADDIDAGLSLSQAMEKQSHVFSLFYVNMIRSAEITGRIDEATNFLADHIEAQADMASKVKGALTYPIVMVVLFIIVTGIITTVVIPQLAPIFEESNIELPFFTQLIINAGTFMATWWWLVLLSIAFLIYVVADYFTTDEGKVVIDEIVLKIPGFSKLLKQLYIARSIESLAVLLRGAIPLAQAVEIVAQTVGSPAYRDIYMKIADDVRGGELFSRAIARYPEYIPPFVSQMTAIGEKTGRLDNMLQRVSSFYAKEIDAMVGGLVELIQPILMVVIGLMVGGLFASILMPIYNLAQSF